MASISDNSIYSLLPFLNGLVKLFKGFGYGQRDILSGSIKLCCHLVIGIKCHFKAKMEVMRYSIDSTLWYGDTSLTGRTFHALLGPRPPCADTGHRKSGDMEEFWVLCRAQNTADMWRKLNTCRRKKLNNRYASLYM